MNFIPISEQDARSQFNWDCDRIKQEYRGQQLFLVQIGKYIDLLYQKGDTYGYLTTVIHK